MQITIQKPKYSFTQVASSRTPGRTSTFDGLTLSKSYNIIFHQRLLSQTLNVDPKKQKLFVGLAFDKKSQAIKVTLKETQTEGFYKLSKEGHFSGYRLRGQMLPGRFVFKDIDEDGGLIFVRDTEV